MASVAKWLRHWFVVPASGGSSPLVRPYIAQNPNNPRIVGVLRFKSSIGLAADRVGDRFGAVANHRLRRFEHGGDRFSHRRRFDRDFGFKCGHD
jgi:hypothetical protein